MCVSCLGLVPRPEKCCVCRSNTKEYLERIPNRTPEQEALESITNRLSTQGDYTSHEFTDDKEQEEEEELPDLTGTAHHIILHFIEIYNKEMQCWYSSCARHYVGTSGNLNGSMNRHTITVDNRKGVLHMKEFSTV